MRIAIPENLTERVPADLALAIALTLACILFVLAPRLNETPVRVLLGLALVLFLPGYSLIAALFPRRDGIERIALSFGLSIAIVPLIGLGLNYTQYGIRLVPVLFGLSLFTVLLALVAYIRRGMVSEGERFVVVGWGLGCDGDSSGGGRGRSGSGDEGRGGGLAREWVCCGGRGWMLRGLSCTVV